MKLSIITVNLNNRNGLKKTIDSVVSQTFKDFEWIVIDGGSTDGSRELIEKYSEYFTYWCSEPDKGIYNAMNKGVIKAKGEYLLFLNSGDSLYEDSTLKKVSKVLDGDVVYGDALFGEQGRHSEITSYPQTMSIRFLYYNALCHQSTFFKRSLFDDQQYDENFKLVSDWDFTVRLLFENKSFKHIPFIVCNFEGDGESSKNDKLFFQERATVLEHYYPKAYIEDFRLVSCTESHLANTKLTDFCSLCKRHRLLAKVITLTVLIMHKLGK